MWDSKPHGIVPSDDPCEHWGILFSHPADYTPVCTTELGRVATLTPEFEKRGVKLIALSCDGVESHRGWIKNQRAKCWGILFSHPADYTPVCTTELGRVATLTPEFEKRGVKLIALSCDGVESHRGWIKDIRSTMPSFEKTWPYRSWGILFSHPADYTPVCTTELGRVATLTPEFEKRGVKLIALSCDGVESHRGWIKDIVDYAKFEKTWPYPIIADPKRELAVQFGMLDPDEKDSAGIALTARCVFIIGPDKKLKLSLLYPATTGRNFDEILRVIDSLQLTATKRVATPADWKSGEDCMVLPNISEEDAAKLFPQHRKVAVPSGKGYIRLTPQP
eukprot:XP_011663577.1 PREDICTED: peroxiredoxin-6 [Strongylocentrotus purpuratus]